MKTHIRVPTGFQPAEGPDQLVVGVVVGEGDVLPEVVPLVAVEGRGFRQRVDDILVVERGCADVLDANVVLQLPLTVPLVVLGHPQVGARIADGIHHAIPVVEGPLRSRDADGGTVGEHCSGCDPGIDVQTHVEVTPLTGQQFTQIPEVGATAYWRGRDRLFRLPIPDP